MCQHCKKHVEEALNGLADTTAAVDLENNLARVETVQDDSILKNAIEKLVIKWQELKMSNEKVLLRLKTARGQIDAVIKMIEDERYCIDYFESVISYSIQLIKNS